jgi:hypothetical protein
VVDTILKNSSPNSLALFCRDDGNLSTALQQECKVPATKREKRIYSYEVDFVDPVKIT